MENNVVINIDSLVKEVFVSADGTIIDKEDISKKIIEALTF